MVDRDYNKNIKGMYDFWKSQVPIIKKQNFDRNQIYFIKKDFINQLHSSIITDEIFKDRYGPELKILESELNIVLEIAFSNYRKEKKSFWENVFGYSLKTLPQLINK